MKKKFLSNNDGVAIIIVMGAITIMTLLLGTFSYVTSINKIRIYNNQDKRQARLAAEAGLNMALAQLQIYKEAFNLYQKNKSIQSMIPFNLLESALTQPFAYPIPVNKDSLNLIQKSAVEDFEKSTKLKGSMLMMISPITGFINPNGLMIVRESNDQDNFNQNEQDTGDKEPLHKLIKKELIELLDREISRKIEEDDKFAEKYGNLEPEKLANELQYFVTNPSLYNNPDKGDFEILYEEYQPKFAPLTSKEELYLLAGWPEEIINLVIDRLSPHNITLIPLNKISKAHLRVLFPQMPEEQIDDFFIQRDGDPKQELPPSPIKNLNDFKKIIKLVSSISESEINKRLAELKKMGLELSVASKVYQVEISGSYRQATQKISAVIDLPVLPTSVEKKTPQDTQDDPRSPISDNPNNERTNSESGGSNNETKKEKEATQLMDPRVVEIFYE